MENFESLVLRAQQGDVEAFGHLVRVTQAMVYAVARGVLREPSSSEDAAQQAYLRAFRRLGELEDPATFPAWLRRIVVTVALNVRRSRRVTFLQLDDVPEVPVLDETEGSWSERQRQRLATALLTLSPEERQMCDRRYYGRWTIGRLAATAGVEEPAMRKRLQRIREKLRREIEMAEQRHVPPGELRADFPEHLAELLARPRLTDLPENPVGKVLAQLRSTFPEFSERALPEVVDLSEARAVAREAMYIDPIELQRVDDRRILRYDLTLPLLLTVRYEGEPLRVWANGKAYRACQVDATHLEAFHQAEVFWLDDRTQLDPWLMTGRVLQSTDAVLPGRAVKIVPTTYPMCRQAWDLEVEDDGYWFELMAFGVFTDAIVRHIGGDPTRHIAVGVGYGLERLAMLRYRIDDIRRIDMASVA
jgi:RNA polymerase sigma-70 factor (ECF subfamily)